MITEANQLCNPKTDPKEIYVYDYVLNVMKTLKWEDFIEFLNDEIYDKSFSLDRDVIVNQKVLNDGSEIA